MKLRAVPMQKAAVELSRMEQERERLWRKAERKCELKLNGGSICGGINLNTHMGAYHWNPGVCPRIEDGETSDG